MKYEVCLECRHNASTKGERRNGTIYCAYLDGKNCVEIYAEKDGWVKDCPKERGEKK